MWAIALSAIYIYTEIDTADSFPLLRFQSSLWLTYPIFTFRAIV